MNKLEHQLEAVQHGQCWYCAQPVKQMLMSAIMRSKPSAEQRYINLIRVCWQCDHCQQLYVLDTETHEVMAVQVTAATSTFVMPG